MNTIKINYIVDILLTFLFIIVAITGFFMYLFIPEGIPQGRYQVYMGLTKSTWTLMHNRTSIILTFFAIIHFILHFKWMTCITGKLFRNIGKRDLELTCEQVSGDKINKKK